MPGNYIYVVEDSRYDYSRWLQISVKGSECTLHLGDLCHPGQLSDLASVTCPLAYFKSAFEHGTLQVTTDSGYVVARRDEGNLVIEFRGNGDSTTCKVCLRSAEVQARISVLEEEQQARAS